MHNNYTNDYYLVKNYNENHIHISSIVTVDTVEYLQIFDIYKNVNFGILFLIKYSNFFINVFYISSCICFQFLCFHAKVQYFLNALFYFQNTEVCLL